MKQKKNNKDDFDKVFKQIAQENNLRSIQSLGSGGFGKVYEVKSDKIIKSMAAKLTKDDEKEENESNLILELRGPNIVKVNKIYSTTISIKKNEEKYSLILMEKAPLKDLKTFVKMLREENVLKYAFKNPFEIIGDNFARFIIKQLVKGFETLYMANCAHFDFKPENTLIFSDIVMKLSDFGFLRNLNEIKIDKNIVKVPGGTQGYFPPEIYSNNSEITLKTATTLDYFSLGATIFYIKYGDKMLKFEKFKDNLITANYMIDLMQRAMDKIKTTKSNDKDFIDFLCKLIQYDPEGRLSFEEIQRNKWLNKNWNEILEVVETNQANEVKMIEELNKTDFLFEKKNYLNEKRKLMDKININAKDQIEDNNNNNNDNANKDNINNNNRKQINKVNYHKFKLKL
jgi:serine/threonine protein kinase